MPRPSLSSHSFRQIKAWKTTPIDDEWRDMRSASGRKRQTGDYVMQPDGAFRCAKSVFNNVQVLRRKGIRVDIGRRQGRNTFSNWLAAEDAYLCLELKFCFPSPSAFRQLFSHSLPSLPSTFKMTEILKTTIIRTPRLTLRPMTMEDAKVFFDIRGHPDIYKWTCVGLPFSTSLMHILSLA